MVITTGALTQEESSIVRGINSAIKKTEGRYCCGGSLPNPADGIRIWYSKEDGCQELLKLPLHPYDDASIDALIAACPRGEKEFVHELVPPCFGTSLELGQFFILDEIQTLLAPGAVLRAKLKALSVIETGGDQQLVQVSSDCEKEEAAREEEGEFFGLLVIGLPVASTGGELIVSNGATSRGQSLNWGAAVETIQWAACIAASEVKICEVTSGYQLRLSYKLYSSAQRSRVLALVDAHSLPLYDRLCEARDCSSFFCGGRVLGFAGQRVYEVSAEVIKEVNHKDEKQWLLKGSDAMLFAAAKAAGLRAELRPVYRNGGGDSPAVLYIGKIVGEKAPAFLGEFSKEFDGLDGDTSTAEELPRVRDGVDTDAEVSWCLKNFVWRRGFRDEDGEVPWYQATALLVTFPSWAEREERLRKRKKMQSEDEEEEEPASKKSRIYEDAITQWFQKAEARANREIDYDFRVDEENDESEDEDEDDEDGNEKEDEEDDGEDDDGDDDDEGNDDGEKGKTETASANAKANENANAVEVKEEEK